MHRQTVAQMHWQTVSATSRHHGLGSSKFHFWKNNKKVFVYVKGWKPPKPLRSREKKPASSQPAAAGRPGANDSKAGKKNAAANV